MNLNKITALYCRLSREDEKVEISGSIETQKEYIKRYARDNKLFNIKYYIDDGYSGTTFDRPGFQELLKDIYNGLVSTVITKDLSRLGRDYLQVGYYTEHYFPLNDIRYIAINDSVDTDNSDNELAPFRNIMNEWYARDISKKIRSAYKTKALNGEFTGAYAPYGYDKDPKDKHHLIMNQEQALIVKKIFNLYLQDLSPYKIAKTLKNDKVLTPRAYLNQKTKTYNLENTIKYPYDWANRTITQILNNEVYIGNVVCNKNQTINYKSKLLKRNPEDKWIISTNKHASIIDISVFNKVQEKLLINKKMPRVEHANIFKGKLRCSTCGATLALSIRGERKSYGSFACVTFRRYGKERCSMHYITYEKVKELITSQINLINKLASKNKLRFPVYKGYELEINNVQQRQNEVQKIIKRLYEDFLLGKITEEKYNILDETYDSERKELILKIKEYQIKSNELRAREQKYLDFVEKIKKYEKIFELTREVIEDLTDKVVIFEKEPDETERKIEIFYKEVGIIKV